MGSNPWVPIRGLPCSSPPIIEQYKQILYPDIAIVIQIGRAIITVITRPPIPQKNQQVLHADCPITVRFSSLAAVTPRSN